LLPRGDELPPLAEMAPMMRRRVEGIGRMALQSAYRCQGEATAMPVVLASRYGDTRRALAQLGELCKDQPLSPTGFGLSVHNAIGALYSIARGDIGNYISVAAGRASAAAGVVEAVGLLAEGEHEEALLVCYDAALPQPHADFADEPECAYAWAWRVALPVGDEPRCVLTARCAEEVDSAGGIDDGLPCGLQVLRFALGADAQLDQTADGRTWEWRRHG
jgi:hypothetical protein